MLTTHASGATGNKGSRRRKSAVKIAYTTALMGTSPLRSRSLDRTLSGAALFGHAPVSKQTSPDQPVRQSRGRKPAGKMTNDLGCLGKTTDVLVVRAKQKIDGGNEDHEQAGKQHQRPCDGAVELGVIQDVAGGINQYEDTEYPDGPGDEHPEESDL